MNAKLIVILLASITCLIASDIQNEICNKVDTILKNPMINEVINELSHKPEPESNYRKKILEAEDKTKFKAHACLMIIGWMVLASTGITIARYYRDTFSHITPKFWFFLHQPLMITVTTTSIIAFLLILSQLNWSWVSRSDGTVEFVHSIFGVLAIIFAIMQVTFGLFRPSTNSQYRFIFNNVHRITGVSAFLCSITALLLGVNMEGMNLDNYGWGIVTAWIAWIFLFPLIAFESRLVYNREDYNQVDESRHLTTRVSSIRNFTLILHHFSFSRHVKQSISYYSYI
jgi:hypothetical protein